MAAPCKLGSRSSKMMRSNAAADEKQRDATERGKRERPGNAKTKEYKVARPLRTQSPGPGQQ